MQWSELRSFGRIRMFRLIHIPTFSYLSIITFKRNWMFDLVGSVDSIGAMWWLYVACGLSFFVGSISLSIALLIYDLACPSRIRRFETDYEFYKAQKTAHSNFNALTKEKIEFINAYYADAGANTAERLRQLRKDVTDLHIKMFASSWEEQDKRYKYLRICCGVSFSIAVIAISLSLLLGPGVLFFGYFHR